MKDIFVCQSEPSRAEPSRALSPNGFVSIVALGIFALLTIFGIIVQLVVMDTIESVKSTRNYYQASDIAGSMTEYLRMIISQHEAGYNADVICAYGEFAEKYGEEGDTSYESDGDLCLPASQIAYETGGEGFRNIEIKMEVQGRNDDNEKIRSDEDFGMNMSSYYIVPAPGTGTAGVNCDLYEPVLEENTSGSVYIPDDLDGDEYQGTLDQIDYSCNWNKLTFGSSLTDRVSIPLYYDDGVSVVNPFKENTDGNFALRIRPPCAPLATGERFDPTVCIDDNRYELDDGSITDDTNDIVVSWQMNGLCGGEECGVINYIRYQADGNEHQDFSGITENDVNTELNNKILTILKSGADTSTYELALLYTKLQEMEKPTLNLLLNEKLLSDERKNVPYLEYQLVTNYPVSDSRVKILVTINVNGNIFEKELFKEQEKGLIDFAIQN